MNTYLLNNLAADPDLLANTDYHHCSGKREGLPRNACLVQARSHRTEHHGSDGLLHLVCGRALRRHEYRTENAIAIAGGVSLPVPLDQGSPQNRTDLARRPLPSFSADGRNRRGKRTAIVVLQRAAPAVVAGGSPRSSGAPRSTTTVRQRRLHGTERGQADAITAALTRRASSETIGYVEAHGTGTLLGDPIEIAALTVPTGGGASERLVRSARSRATSVISMRLPVHSTHQAALAIITARFRRAALAEPNPQIDFANSLFFA